ncbi:putative F-box protein At4g22165 [Tasmannia lanceolata]|uniref:putative F-box protein At4g22165 n=1 Tax=Tasmannia lanceolata TaxID=3420 RepID=UPI0040643A81
MGKVEHRWSELPMDIMILILHWLSLKDQVSCAGVCIWWRKIISENPHPSSQQPLVLLSENQNSETRRFLSPYEGKVYNLNLPEAHGFQCCGSSGQWMIMTDQVKRYFLLHPFSRIKIQLPYKVPLQRVEFKLFNIKKAMVFSPPTFSDDHKTIENCVVVALCRNRGIYSCRVGDKSWTSIGKEGCEYEDFIFYKGNLYAMTTSGTLEASNLGAKDWSVRKWVLMESVGDSALFVGESCSISLEASGLLGFRENCVSFIHNDNFQMFCRENNEIKLYFLGDLQSLESCFHLKDLWITCTNLWVTTHPYEQQ